MKDSNFLAALAGLILFLNSCTYTNDGEHFVSPIPGDPPVFSVSCNLDTMLFIETSDSVFISYSAEIENGTLYVVAAEVNEQLTYDTVANLEADTAARVLRDSFYVQKDVDLLVGENFLNLIFYISTNSNTLGDLYDVEADLRMSTYSIYLREDEK